jgi:hypothetical protein
MGIEIYLVSHLGSGSSHAHQGRLGVSLRWGHAHQGRLTCVVLPGGV